MEDSSQRRSQPPVERRRPGLSERLQNEVRESASRRSREKEYFSNTGRRLVPPDQGKKGKANMKREEANWEQHPARRERSSDRRKAMRGLADDHDEDDHQQQQHQNDNDFALMKELEKDKVQEAKAIGAKINGMIKAVQVRLIGKDGENIGVVPRREAMVQAKAAESDLILIVDKASPPVCRIQDFTSYKYQQEKASKKAKKKFEIGKE